MKSLLTCAMLLALLALLTPSSVAAAAPLPFIEDDYAAAHNQASARKLPIFVDVWAPW